MLNANELKLVASTLAQRRAWLRKSIEAKDVNPATRSESLEAIKLLDSAIAKLTANAPNKRKPLSKAEKPRAIPIAQCRVLVAEDSEDSATLVIDILEAMGIKLIDHAKDGIEAFDYIKKAEEPYHLVLCDWDMPGLSGIEVHSKAKASNTLRNAHFVMVTAMGDAARIKKAAQQGVNDYVVKPVEMETLEAKIRTAIAFTEAAQA